MPYTEMSLLFLSNPKIHSLKDNARVKTNTHTPPHTYGHANPTLSPQGLLVPLFRHHLAEPSVGLSQQKDGKVASCVGSGQEVVLRHCRGGGWTGGNTHTHYTHHTHADMPSPPPKMGADALFLAGCLWCGRSEQRHR